MSRFVTTLAILLLAFAPTLAAEPRKPNIVVILADDLGYADLGYQGCKAKEVRQSEARHTWNRADCVPRRQGDWLHDQDSK